MVFQLYFCKFTHNIDTSFSPTLQATLILKLSIYIQYFVQYSDIPGSLTNREFIIPGNKLRLKVTTIILGDIMKEAQLIVHLFSWQYTCISSALTHFEIFLNL